MTDPEQPAVPHGVYIANVCPGNVNVHFTKSLVDLIRADEQHGWDLWRGNLWTISGANISKSRNELVTRFLALDGEWLLFLDSDMVFPPDTIVRLLAAARHADTKIIGGLCVMVTDLGPIPTLYQFDSLEGSDGITRVQFDYPDNSVLQVAATGAACLMVHRSVLEKVQADQGGSEYAWFQECTIERRGRWHWVSEDLAFCLRAGEAGFDTFVDCTLEIGHFKHGRVWTARDIREGMGVPPRKTVAIIPTLGASNGEGGSYVEDLVRQLIAERCDEIVVVKNDRLLLCPPWWRDHKNITVLDGAGMGIHQMWNLGVDHAIERHSARVRIAFLNDDLRIGSDFLKRLSRALDDHPEITAVCGNYDGRTAEDDIVRTNDICAARYDGTGGFAGFAFMVRGEWFTSGYRFPEVLEWWCGDNDLLTAINYSSTDDAPKGAAIVLNAEVEHLDGGGGTAGDPMWSDPKWDEVKARDIAAFNERWARIAAQDEARAQIAAGDLTPIYRRLCDTPSDINEHLPTLYDLVQKLDAKKVIELGTRGGTSTVAWLAALHRTDGHLWAVDINPCPRELADHPRLTFMQGHDLDPFVLSQLPGGVDIVFVDTDHTYELTQAEIAEYSKRVRQGGVMVFHDTAVREHDHHDPGQPPYPVRKAVEEWVAADGLEVTEYANNFGLTVVTL